MSVKIPRRIFLKGALIGNAAVLAWPSRSFWSFTAGAAPGNTGDTLCLVLEGEDFDGLNDFDQTGWRAGVWETDSYQTCTFGGVHIAHKRFLFGAADARAGEVSKMIVVPAAGTYRVWAKYEAPPNYNTRFDIRIIQSGRTVFDLPYGGADHLRQYAFTRENRAQQYWPWGTDHDVGEGLDLDVQLEAGPATVIISKGDNPEPAAERHIDCLMLTTDLSPVTGGAWPGGLVFPVLREISEKNFVYLRLANPAEAPFPIRGNVVTSIHRSPWNNFSTALLQQSPGPWIEPGDSSPWIPVKVDAATDTTLSITTRRLEGGMDQPNDRQDFVLDIAGDSDGGRPIRSLRYTAESASLRIEVPSDWMHRTDPAAATQTAEEICAQLLQTIEGFPDFGSIPQQIRFYGTVGVGHNPEVTQLLQRIKARLGYNSIGQRSSATGLATEVAAFRDAGGQLIERSFTFVHTFDPVRIQQIYNQLEAEGTLQYLDYLSYGDEIHPPRPPVSSEAQREALRPAFIQFLSDRGVSAGELGIPSLDEARITTLAQVRGEEGSTRLYWYSELFLEQSGLNVFAQRTALAESLFGLEVATGVNYSPHPFYWLDIGSWIDVFKNRVATMPWSEDFTFSQPEMSRQVMCYLTDMARAGARYHDLKIRMYVMPHAPGNTPTHVRMNTYAALAHGAKVIDNFWCGPQMFFTENFVRQDQIAMYHVLHDLIREIGIAEDLLHPGRVRPGKVGLLISRATDVYEKSDFTEYAVPESALPEEKVDRSVYNEERKNIYYALRHAQIAVDLITEEDIADGYLDNYQVLYLVGDRVQDAAAGVIANWVQGGGVLFASAGGGFLNQFDEPSSALSDVYGVLAQSLTKSVTVLRAKMELPRAQVIDQVSLELPDASPSQFEALGYHQRLVPAAGAQVLGTYSDGSAAVVQNDYGQGHAVLVGTLPGAAYVRPAIPLRPMDKGGADTKLSQLIPTDFAPGVRALIEYPVRLAGVARDVECSGALVEVTLLESASGWVVPLINYSTQTYAAVDVRIRNLGSFSRVRTVYQTNPAWRMDGSDLIVTLPLDLTEMVLIYR